MTRLEHMHERLGPASPRARPCPNPGVGAPKQNGAPRPRPRTGTFTGPGAAAACRSRASSPGRAGGDTTVNASAAGALAPSMNSPSAPRSVTCRSAGWDDPQGVAHPPTSGSAYTGRGSPYALCTAVGDLRLDLVTLADDRHVHVPDADTGTGRRLLHRQQRTQPRRLAASSRRRSSPPSPRPSRARYPARSYRLPRPRAVALAAGRGARRRCCSGALTRISSWWVRVSVAGSGRYAFAAASRSHCARYAIRSGVVTCSSPARRRSRGKPARTGAWRHRPARCAPAGPAPAPGAAPRSCTRDRLTIARPSSASRSDLSASYTRSSSARCATSGTGSRMPILASKTTPD